MSDDAVSSGGTAIESTLRAFGETRSAVGLSVEWMQRWVQRRGRLTQLLIGGFTAVFIERGLDAGLSMVEAVPLDVFVLAPGQLLAVLAGIALIQTVLQVRKLFHIDGRLQDMDRPAVLPDGGEEVRRRTDDPRPAFAEGTSGGGAIGGAIAGAGIGAPYGVSGLVFGAVVGWILGDEFEQRVLIPPEFR